MSSDNEFTVHVKGENLNLKIAPGSEEEWKRAVSLVELAAELDGVELGSSELQSFEDVAEHFENEVGDLRREFDSVQTQLETVMDNFVSDEELESKLNSIEETIQEDGSASLDVDEKLSAMWEMIDKLEEKVEEVHQDRESQSSSEDLSDDVEEASRREQDEVEESSLGEEGSVEDEESSDAEGRSLSDIREKSVEDRNELVFELIKRHQPVHGISELGEYVYGHEVESGTKEYGELGNRVSDIQDRIEKESDGTSTVYYVDGEKPEKADGAQRLDDIDQNDIEGMSLICTVCQSGDAVFDGVSGAKRHRRDEDHDSWVIAAIPNDDWKNGKTVENIVERRTA
ncbi:hypothetical protein [Natrinema altunense]|uniref:Uncharacterized protein n=1 Tax=Natrinema altunense (strain JCM 12890 / CGMCC 1.3731 / AJ2) TaxID=1227494 RepID=L9ZDJ6_NATA2|nr:hypothetical protein [Natrinema altunense]ELY83667.1 hypothetical protein C485_17982 [Natrinema altunense JCM 12890]